MKIAVIGFTPAGAAVVKKLCAGLEALGHRCLGYTMPKYAAREGLMPVEGRISQWTSRWFSQVDGFIFVGAAGIAVRCVAPLLRDKLTDPAVVSVDEQERFAVSLISGHVGGANRLTILCAAITGAQPVVSTATDLNGLFAVDSWAASQRLTTVERERAKAVSASLLCGEQVGFYSDYPVNGCLPQGLTDDPSARPEAAICVCSDRTSLPFGPEAVTLHLLPKQLVIGMGCRRGVGMELLERGLFSALEQLGSSIGEVYSVCSIDLKKEEPGLLALCHKYRLPFFTYSAAQLLSVEGMFTGSAFVSSVTGVDNVCERAAALGAGGGSAALCLRKQGANGVTVAAARREHIILTFEENEESVL